VTGQAQSRPGSHAVKPATSSRPTWAKADPPSQPGERVTPISTATNKALKPITVGSVPDAIVITPDGKTADCNKRL